MTQNLDRHLIQTIKYAPVVMVVACFIAVLFFFHENNQQQNAINRAQLRNDLIDEQRNIVKQHVHRLKQKVTNDSINIERDIVEELHKELEVYYSVILDIYQQSGYSDSPSFRLKIINYITTLQLSSGFRVIVLDEKGGIIVSLGDNDDNLPAYKQSITLEELGWTVSTLIDKPTATRSAQREALDWLSYFSTPPEKLQSSQLRTFESDDLTEDYLFILDSNYKFIMHSNKNLLNQAFSDIAGFNLSSALYGFSNYEGYVLYQLTLPGEQKSGRAKISYLTTIPEWGWLIGSGFYLDRFDQNLIVREQKATIQNDRQTRRLFMFAAVMSIVLLITSLFLGYHVSQKIKRYQFRVKLDMFKLADAKEKLQRTIDYDTLTGLPSQYCAKEKVMAALTSASINSERVIVIMLDIVGLKRINNLHSHYIGDMLIKDIAQQFKDFINNEDFVCRYRGDEFLFCFTTSQCPSKINNKVDSIKAIFEHPFIVEGNICSVDCRMGISTFPESGSDAEMLIEQAISVLYRTKIKQPSPYLIINEDLAEKIRIEQKIEEDLSEAIDNGEILVYFQPQINAKTEELQGLEALVRWEHPELGFVRPDQLVEIAEEQRLVRKLGNYVARYACQQVVTEFPNEKSDVTISINVSPQELHLECFVDDFVEAVEASGIHISRVVLEITENILIEEPKSVIPILQEIKDKGIHVSMDDFGTGYSSLSYFNLLPISELKIDRAFVKNITGEEGENLSLIKAIIAIGKSKDTLIVVEGVETKVQRDTVAELGCDLIQGYYYSPPKPLSDICVLFSNNRYN